MTIQSSEPTMDLGAPSALDQPVIHQPARQIKIMIVSEVDEGECSFWVGLAKQGPADPSTLLDLHCGSELLRAAATQGISETPPVLISNTEQQPPRFALLVATPPADFRSQAAWVSDLIDTVSSCAPNAVGFYFPTDLIGAGERQAILNQLAFQLIEATAINTYYLFDGGPAGGSTLNAALKIKSDIESSDLGVLVLH